MTIPLINEKWQPVPGTKNTRIFPLLRKPDVTSSNVYILKIGKCLCLIDTGASQELMNIVFDVFADVKADTNSPILIIFGHVHFDHIYQGLVERRFETVGRPVYISHAFGAGLLESGDRMYTQADLVDLPMPPLKIDIPLFQKCQNTNEQTSQELLNCRITQEKYLIPGEISLLCEQMTFPDGETMTFWETPGHSADSMTIQVGNLLHVGDIPFATGPGVAGVHGWDPVELDKTIKRLTWILQTEQISVICTGHGKILNRELMEKNLHNLKHDLDTLPELGIFDRNRISQSMKHATDLIEEVHRLFPILAGRMMLLIHRLEELEEYEVAKELERIIPDEEIDRILDNFETYYSEFQTGNRPEIQVVLKALQTLQKIESFLPRHNIENLIDQALFRRCVRLFSDLLSTMQGVIPSGSIAACSPVELIQDLAGRNASCRIDDEEILQATDDEEIFRKILVQRIATFQNRSDIRIQIDAPKHPLIISADSERLSDFMSALFDYYNAYGAEQVRISITHSNEKIRIGIFPEGPLWHPKIPLSRALLRTVRYAGGEISKMPTKEDEEICLVFKEAISL